MKKHCRLCGKNLEGETEKKRGICKECQHKGFIKLSKVLGKMKEKVRGKNSKN
ncbi:MAG: hypothetical protein MUP58_02605 [Candidatus Nanohaloarchaeota archaeon QJJ-9]|nr:hypothetical protein [Candidatus Nanohaloarchaeota archaeon QJJ-9]